MAYDPLTDCKWNLTAPQGHYVTLDFEIIDVSNKYLDVIYHLSSLLVKNFNPFIFVSFTLIMIMIT